MVSLYMFTVYYSCINCMMLLLHLSSCFLHNERERERETDRGMKQNKTQTSCSTKGVLLLNFKLPINHYT